MTAQDEAREGAWRGTVDVVKGQAAVYRYERDALTRMLERVGEQVDMYLRGECTAVWAMDKIRRVLDGEAP